MDSKRLKAIEERLSLIASKNEGSLTPEDVVNDAKYDNSPLHKFFEWDDGEAAAKYRLEQARQLIRSVRVNVTVKEAVFSVVKYVRNPDLKSGPQGEQGYLETSRIKKKSDMAREVMMDEIVRLNSITERVESLAAALGLINELDALKQSVFQLSNKLEEVA